MNDSHETVVLQFLDALHDEVHPDLSGALAGFAEDAVYRSLVPARPPIVGRNAIQTELSTQFGRYTDCVCEIVAMASNDRFVFTERRDHVTMTSWAKRIFSSVNAVFEFDERGLIVSWREYWDTGDIASQLGLTSDQMKALHGVAANTGTDIDTANTANTGNTADTANTDA
jgi:limonene-1,2-epoxide hydrolase